MPVVLVRDGWAPYRRFTDAAHQTCLAHLLRRATRLGRATIPAPRSPPASRSPCSRRSCIKRPAVSRASSRRMAPPLARASSC